MNREYAERIKDVIRYIEENSGRRLTLDELAEHSHFSKYHFSRIFTYVAGTSPIAYVNQVRLQKSLPLLTETARTVLDISQECGFESVTAFNTAFKKMFHQTPSEVRKSSGEVRNILPALRNNQEELLQKLHYDKERKDNSFLRRIWDMNVKVKELPSYEVAYVRHTGSYLETWQAWRVLNPWAFGQGLTPDRQHFIGISLDDPCVVEEADCRYDACVTLPADFHREVQPDEIRFQKLPGGMYAVYPFYDTVDKLAIAYQSLFEQWLPDSGYDADDRYCLEICLNNPMDDPEGKAKVEICLPVIKRA